MEGYVSARHALVPLIMRGANGQAEVDFVLDTGFAGFLTMPLTEIDTLGLPYSHPTFAHLADGSIIVLDVYRRLFCGTVRNAALRYL